MNNNNNDNPIHRTCAIPVMYVCVLAACSVSSLHAIHNVLPFYVLYIHSKLYHHNNNIYGSLMCDSPLGKRYVRYLFISNSDISLI